jgi:hypothetical protein
MTATSRNRRAAKVLASNFIGSEIATILDGALQNHSQGRNLTGKLIHIMWNDTDTFGNTMLANYFKSENRTDAQRASLSLFCARFADEQAELKQILAKPPKKADKDYATRQSRREQIEADHKSMMNTYHSAMEAVFFLRHGGKVGESDYGTIANVDLLPSGSFHLHAKQSRMVGKKKETVLADIGVYSPTALGSIGRKHPALPKSPKSTSGRKRKDAKGTTTQATSPLASVVLASKNIATMFDGAMKEMTATINAGKPNGDKVAAFNDLPKPMRHDINEALATMLKARLPMADGKVQLVDVIALIEEVTSLKVDDTKQVPPLKVKAPVDGK